MRVINVLFTQFLPLPVNWWNEAFYLPPLKLILLLKTLVLFKIVLKLRYTFHFTNKLFDKLIFFTQFVFTHRFICLFTITIFISNLSSHFVHQTYHVTFHWKTGQTSFAHDTLRDTNVHSNIRVHYLPVCVDYPAG